MRPTRASDCDLDVNAAPLVMCVTRQEHKLLEVALVRGGQTARTETSSASSTDAGTCERACTLGTPCRRRFRWRGGVRVDAAQTRLPPQAWAVALLSALTPSSFKNDDSQAKPPTVAIGAIAMIGRFRDCQRAA
jgi:hypothetical protein